MNRPCWCYDKLAEIIYTSYSDEVYEKGYSCFCYGKMVKPNDFIFKEANHVNDICHCYYTPLKGAIRFFVCKGDLFGEIQAKLIVLNKISPLSQCVDCGEKVNRRLLSGFAVNNGGIICLDCMRKKGEQHEK